MIAVIIVALVLVAFPLGSYSASIFGIGTVPSIHPVQALPGPPVLGIDCALGNSADSPNPFPTPIATKDSDGVIDSSCLWTGDFDGDTHTPFPTFDPLVSDSPELAASGLGGGVIFVVRYTNGNNTINAFDISVGYNPAVLDFVAFDQSGLLFGGNVGCPISNPNCTLGLSNLVDRQNGVVRLAQAIEGVTTGGSPNSVTLFRMRFDVVGSGSSGLTFGASSPSVPSKNIVTFVIPPNITGPEAHSTLNSAFSTQSIFQLTNSVAAGSFTDSWTFSPNPEVPFAPLTFSATAAACDYCTAPFTYQWDFSSFDSSGYIAKISATGQTVTMTLPPPIANRVALTVTDSAAHSVTLTRDLPVAGAAQGPSTAVQGTPSAAFTAGFMGGVSAECVGGSCTGTGSTGYTATWRFCPGGGFVRTVCTNPNAAAAADPATIPGVTWNFAGTFNTVFSVSDSSPSQVGGPQTVAKTFPVNVTGATPAFTVSVAADKTSVQAGSPVTITPTTAYVASYPLSFQSTLFSYDFNWGDGTPDTTVSAGTTTSQLHTYLAGGSFIVRVAVQETGAAAPTSIVENGFSPTINVAGPFNFQVSVAPTGATVAAGSGTTATVMATLLSGTTQSVSFSATGQPAGSTVTLLPTSCSPTCTSQMSITTSASTPPGTFPITITGTATGGVASMTTFTLIVIPPVVFAVTISCPLTGSVGTAVACTATSSGGTGTVTFAWTATGGSPASGTGASFSPIYSVKGTVSISVTGTDSATPTPHTNTKSASVMIGALPVAIVQTVPTTGTVNAPVSVSASASGGTSPYVFSWSFGDGTANVLGATPSHNYATKGTFTVKVNATDTNGVIVSASSTILISALPVTVTPTVPTGGTVGTSVSVSAIASGGTSPYAFSWSFGDGSAKVTGATATHTYTAKGTFTVKVNATDNNGVIGSNSAMITIAALTLTTDFSISPTTVTANTPIVFTATTSGGTTPYGYAWAFGDGTTGSTNPVTHTYSTTGPFIVGLTVTDSNTKTATATHT